MSPVLPIYSIVLPGHNQETYQRLQTVVQESASPQLLMAVCDDLPLQRQLAATLEESLQQDGKTSGTQLLVQVEEPDLARQIQNWSSQTKPQQPLVLQILGIEQLTYRGAEAQYQFLRSLHTIPSLWESLGHSLLIWVSRPWFRQIQREVPALCQQRFEFLGEPTPISSLNNRHAYQVAFSPVRQWRFLSRPVPESPPTCGSDSADGGAIAPQSMAVPVVSRDRPASLPMAEPPLTFHEDLWELLREDLEAFEQPLGDSLTTTPLDTKPANPGDRPPLTALEADTSAWLTTLNALALEEPSQTSSAGVASTADPQPRQETHDTAEVAAESATVPSDSLDASSDRETAWAIAYQLRDAIQRGDASPATLETAIRHYEALLTDTHAAQHRTEVLNDLGSLYWLWAQQADTVDTYHERLLRSSSLYEAALSPITPGTEATLLTRVHSNLGSVYSLLAGQQDPLQYLGKAVRAFYRALHYTPVETMPADYVALQTHLGTAYWSLAQHTQETAHLHRAIAAYQEALRHAHPHEAPLPYAQLQNNLGIALWSLSRHGSPIPLLEKAIGAYRMALVYRTLDTDAAGCAATHNNLGTAYWDLGGHYPERSPEQFQAWKEAATAYETALLAAEQVPPAQLGFDRWATHHSLGVVYDQLAILLAPNPSLQAPLLHRSVRHYVKALGGWQALNAATVEVAFLALVRNLQLQARYLGIEAQQRSLSQIPADWLPKIWRKL